MPSRSCRPRPKGFAVIIVLALLSVTLALSYSMMRVQATTHQIENNMSRAADARQAAISGISAGIREMYKAGWGGVDSTISMSLGNNQTYMVRYETGDQWLKADDPDYNEMPFRVTVVSTGYAFDNVTPTIQSQYTIRAVVQLVRRKFQDSNSSTWKAAAGHSLYSYGQGSSYLETPNQVHGKTYINGTLFLMEDWQKTNRPFKGLVDEIVIHDRAMSSFEIYTIRLIGNLTDSTLASALSSYGIRHWWRFNESDSAATVAVDSIGGKNGTYRGGVVPSITVSGTNRAVYLDGVSGRIDLGAFDLPDHADFTINAWIAPFSMSGDNADSRIISRATDTPADKHWWMLSTTSLGSSYYPRVRLKTTAGDYEFIPSSGKLYNNYWTLLTVTFDDSTNKLHTYVNGSLVDTQTVYGTVQATTDVLTWIGDNPPGAARSRFLEALTDLSNAGGEDYRPLSGTVTLSSDRNDFSTALTLYRQLGCATYYEHTSASSPSNTTTNTTYRLYPGGKQYTIPLVAATLQTQKLSSDIDTNPLGVFRSLGTVTIQNDVTLKGTLITQTAGSDIALLGTNVNISAVTLPAIDGDSTIYQLPALISADDIEASSYVQATIEGAIAAYDDWKVNSLHETSKVQVSGLVFSDEFDMQARSDWSSVASSSYDYLRDFVDAVGNANLTANFASWVGENVQPLENNVKIESPATPPTYQWLDLSQPIYAVGDGDDGLVWELVRWKDSGGL